MLKSIIRTISLFCLLYAGNPAFAETKTIVLSIFVSPEESPHSKFFFRIYQEAFRRLGYRYEHRVLPFIRAEVEASKGIVDGEVARGFDHNLKYPNLIRIDELIATICIAAFTARPDIKLANWESLKGTNYKVDFLRGIELIRKSLAPFVKPENIEQLNSRDQAFRRLVSKRADFYIDDEFDMQQQLNSDAFRNKIFKAGVMVEVPVYGFLNKKHEKLAPDLTKVLRDMKREGLFDKFSQQLTTP